MSHDIEPADFLLPDYSIWLFKKSELFRNNNSSYIKEFLRKCKNVFSQQRSLRVCVNVSRRGSPATAASAKAVAPTRRAFARRVRLRAGVALRLPTARAAPLPRLRRRGTLPHLPQKTRPPPPRTPEGTTSGTGIRRAPPPVRPPRAPLPPQRATAAPVFRNIPICI